MTGRRWPGRDRGSFTAELAAGLPALMLLLFAALTAVSAVTAKAQCVDAAREAALAVARGETAPAGVTVELGDDRVTARASEPVRLLGAHLPSITVSATAVAAREPSALESVG
ncbi:MAG TPA: TadE family type IV pilus minor pilin [Actinoplanes sp.]